MLNPELLSNSLAVIKRLQEEDGGITATPKDDAYPYVYPRDAVFMTMALNSFWEFERSKKFYAFLKAIRRPAGEFYQRYNTGFPFVTNEHELDVTPIVIQGIYDTYVRSGDKDFLSGLWSQVEECATFTAGTVDIEKGLVHTTNSIHENRTLEEGYEIWTNSAAVKGLLDASRIAGVLGFEEKQHEWMVWSKSLLSRMRTALYDPKDGVFIKVMRRSGEKVKAPDISQLSPFYFGICNDDRMLERTLDHLKGTLWNKGIGGFNRFRDFEIVRDWHWYTGGAAASWPFFTIWAARFYRKLGMKEGEEDCLRFLESVVTSDLSLPEKVSPVERYNEWKGNELEFGDRIVNAVRKIDTGAHAIEAASHVAWACPLGWAHAEYIFLEKGVMPDAHELLQEPLPTLLNRK